MSKKVLIIIAVFFFIIKIAKCQDIEFTSKERDSMSVIIKSNVTIRLDSGRTITTYYGRYQNGIYDGYYKQEKVSLAIRKGDEIVFQTKDGWHVWRFKIGKSGYDYTITQVTESFADKKNFWEITYK